MNQLPSVALVGRPNVGKSRIFNRLVGRRVSIVHDQEGVTRDLVVADVGSHYTLMDTGGIGLEADMSLKEIVKASEEQVDFALMAADLIIFVVDGRAQRNFLDEEIAEKLRLINKEVLLVANKVDKESIKDEMDDFTPLGYGMPVRISAEHDQGFEFLQSRINKVIGEAPPENENTEERVVDDRFAISLVGRPNVGKSSLSNALLHSERLIVSDVPGTTRDAVELDLDYQLEDGDMIKMRLIDTAGLRTKSKINTSLDYFSSLRTHNSIERSKVIFLVIDAMEGIHKLDKQLGGEILEAGKSLAIIVNKWDYAVEQFEKEDVDGYANIEEFKGAFIKAVRKELFFLPNSPILFTSARTGIAIEDIAVVARQLYERSQTNIPTGKLNRLVGDLVEARTPRQFGTKLFKVYYSVQTKVEPITIRLYSNRHGKLEDAYLRYLQNNFQKHLDIGGCPIRFQLVGKPKRESEPTPKPETFTGGKTPHTRDKRKSKGKK